MINFVDNNVKYPAVVRNTTDKTLFVFDALMESVCVNGIELDSLYYAKNLSEIIGGTIPNAILTALTKRGLLHCDGKCEGKNVYSITTEIYEYYVNVFQPSRDDYIKKYM